MAIRICPLYKFCELQHFFYGNDWFFGKSRFFKISALFWRINCFWGYIVINLMLLKVYKIIIWFQQLYWFQLIPINEKDRFWKTDFCRNLRGPLTKWLWQTFLNSSPKRIESLSVNPFFPNAIRSLPLENIRKP